MSTDDSAEYLRYTRLSKGRASIRRQKTITANYLDKRGGHVIDDFSDSDTTAYAKPGSPRPPRPDFDRLIAVLRARTGLRVIAWHVDRLLRNSEDAAILARACTEGGHIIETPSGGIYDLSTAAGRKRLRDDASDAEHEVDHLRERVLDAKNDARAAGLWLGRARPFGWVRTEETGILAMHPTEGPAVAAAAARMLAGGSLGAIARDWNEQGLRTAAGKTWSSRGVRVMLLRESNWAPPPALWPALIDHATHLAVVGILSSPERRTTPGPEPRHLMSGILRCGIDGCGMTMVARSSVRATTGAVYRCGSVGKPGTKGGVAHVSRDKGRVDEYVSEAVIARFEEADAVAFLHRPEDSELPQLDSQRTALIGAMTASNNLRRKGLLTDLEFADERREHQQRLAELDERIAAARAVNVLAPMLRDPRTEWASMPIDQRRAIVNELAVWTMLPERRGRPRGWTSGQPYFNPDSILIEWR